MNINTDNTGGYWTAIDNDRYDGAPDAGPQQVGHGSTEAEAIADLVEQVQEAEMLADLAHVPSPSALAAAAVLEAHL